MPLTVTTYPAGEEKSKKQVDTPSQTLRAGRQIKAAGRGGGAAGRGGGRRHRTCSGAARREDFAFARRTLFGSFRAAGGGGAKALSARARIWKKGNVACPDGRPKKRNGNPSGCCCLSSQAAAASAATGPKRSWGMSDDEECAIITVMMMMMHRP
jgi:hypothetical protein